MQEENCQIYYCCIRMIHHMTVGEERRERMLKSENCHIVDGIYYYTERFKYAVVVKAEPYLKSIVIPETITFPGSNKKIPVERLSYMAFAYTDITSVTIPQTVKYLSQSVFACCKSLKSVIFCGDVEWIQEDCFSGCSSLERIVLPQKVEHLSSRCFSGCCSLREFVLPENITEIPCSMFCGCTSLITLKFPQNIKTIDSWSFEGCTGLKEVCFDKNILIIGNESFKGCTNLEKITILNKETEIDPSAFQGCSSLQIIETPSNDYKLKDSSFVGCVKLDKSIPLEHTEYGDYLKKEWKKEVKEEKYRRNQGKWWFPIWKGSLFVVLFILFIIGSLLFSGLVMVVVTFVIVYVSLLILVTGIGALLESFSGGRIEFDINKIMANGWGIATMTVISAIVTIVIVVRSLL